MLEKAKENYKDQSLDLKQEIKQLKLQLQNRTASSSRLEGDESTTINGCILKENGNQSSEIIEVIDGKQSKEKKKEEVLGDIRNLIHEYKKERRIQQHNTNI